MLALHNFTWSLVVMRNFLLSCLKLLFWTIAAVALIGAGYFGGYRHGYRDGAVLRRNYRSLEGDGLPYRSPYDQSGKRLYEEDMSPF